MAHSILRRRLIRQTSAGVLTAALLAACGGGEILAVLQIVTPLGGQWRVGNTDEFISFNTADASVQYYASERELTGTVQSVSGVCGSLGGASVAVQGTLDNGKLTLRPAVAGSTNCVEGTFSDLRRFAAAALAGQPARNYDNRRVDVGLNVGLWASENRQITLNFDAPSTVDNDDTANVVGCDVSIPATSVKFEGTLQGFATATPTKPRIAVLRNSQTNAPMFSQVEFVDSATLTMLSATGQPLTLKRIVDPADPVGSPCPP